MARPFNDLGSLEVVSSSSTRQEKHIDALEKRVDALEQQNAELKQRLLSKPSAVTQEDYDELCRKYQMEIDSNLPF